MWPFKEQEGEQKEEGEWTKDPLSTRRALQAVTEITVSLVEKLAKKKEARVQGEQQNTPGGGGSSQPGAPSIWKTWGRQVKWARVV